MRLVREAAATEEVAAAFAAYEAALVADDRAAVLAHFLASDDLARFGVADHQAGSPSCARGGGPAAAPTGPAAGRHPDRRPRRPDRGRDDPVHLPGSPCVGRQSQTWTRRPEGWRIATAHVSELPPAADPAGARKLHLPDWTDYTG